MSRRSVRTTLVVALACTALFPTSSSAQAPKGGATGEFELLQGLRDAGMPDLALDYIDEKLAKSADPAVKADLPLERARTQLELAEIETEDGKRDALMSQARKGFTAFMNTAPPDHPRRPEAAISLGRLTSLSARGALARAANEPEEAKWKAMSAATRPEFEAAVKQYKAAVTALSGLIASAGTPAQKAPLERAKMQAELETAIAQYQIFRTYVKPDLRSGDIQKRGDALLEAVKQFEAIAKAYPNTANAAIALAWIGQCYVQLDDPKKAEAAWSDVMKLQNVSAGAGKRMVRFFQARQAFEKVLTNWNEKDLSAAYAAIGAWLNDFGGGRQTNEHYALRFSYGTLRQQQGLRACIPDKDPMKAPKVTDAARDYFRQAERAFARVTENDNEYSDRAAKKRTECIRFIVGNADQKVADIKTFDEAVMTGLVQFDKYIHGENEKVKKASITRAIELFEHAVKLPAPSGAPSEHAREVLNTKLRLVFAYLMSGNPTLAAVYGDNLARTTRGSNGAKAGLYAVQGYLASMDKYVKSSGLAGAGGADKDRVLMLAAYLDKEFPADPSTDSARIVLGQLYNRDGKNAEAFDVLARVSPNSPKVSTARLIQGLAAFALLRATEGVTPEKKGQVYGKITADINAVPEPLPTASAEDAAVYVRLRLLLAQLQLSSGAGGYAAAEQTATAATALLDPKKFPNISAEERLALQFSASETRLRGLYGQAASAYKDGKFEEVMTKLTPALGEIAGVIGAEGSSVKMVEGMKDLSNEAKDLVKPSAQKLDEFRRETIIVLALQTAIRMADVKKAEDLFGMLKAFGGSTDASVNALTQLVGVVRPQIETLRREKKTDEAKKLVDGVAKLLDLVAKDKDLTTRVRVFLGRSLKDIGAFDQAASILALVPKPPAADLDLPRPALEALATTDTGNEQTNAANKERRLAVIFYRGAQIEYARALRATKKFAEADKVLKEALGIELPKTSPDAPVKLQPGTGWAKGAPDFEKEAVYLLEDKAETLTGAEAAKTWKEALDGWSKFANKYRPMLASLGGGKAGPKEAMLALVKIKQPLPPHDLLPKNPATITAEVIKEGKAPWVVAMLKDKVTVVDENGDSKEVDNPYRNELQAVINRLESQVKPLYYDAFYESTRCLARANSSLLKSNPAKLTEQFGKIANTMKELETKNPELGSEVRAKFADLIYDYPALKKAYVDLQGKMFLEAPPQPAPMAGGGN
jgi:tetratricopeptide (TPR) repeat protein